MTKLIINADDFGMSKVYNKHILQLLFERKITSTTVMVNRISDSQKDQVNQLKPLLYKADISVGLHVEFTYDKHLEQVAYQFKKFQQLFGSSPSHLDIHKEHLHADYHQIVEKFCLSKKVGFRNHGTINSEIKTTAANYFYGSVNNFGEIENWLKSLESKQCYELVFHPGSYDPDCYSSLNKDRETDLEYIEKINKTLSNYSIELVSFNNL